MRPTPYHELNEVLAELRQGIQDVLGQNLIGLYLQGSFALGDFDEHSDVDFIAVSEQELTEEWAAAITAMHGRLFQLPTEWAKHLEGSYFSRAQLHGRPGKPIGYLNHGSTTLERSDHCNTLVVRWTLYHCGIALCGPDIRSLLQPIDTDALKQESRQTLLDWGRDILVHPENYANRFYQGLIALTCCRVLHTVESGQVHSKRASADWAKTALPSKWHGLVARTWSTRPDPYTTSRTPADEGDYRATLSLLRLAMARLGALPAPTEM